MNQNAQPLVSSRGLIILGAMLIMGFTIHGILDNPGELIRNDPQFGPVVAASRIIVPLFISLGFIHLLANITKCKACGKIRFWRKRSTS
ncbi:MAG: hypothetical protein HQL97_15255 [Magnetococcales bacterium]|nr:hypothetical protein [Magnetococcales bacterium]MBF0263186.1 hypothetical protein [Magnetococcales bacterium]